MAVPITRTTTLATEDGHRERGGVVTSPGGGGLVDPLVRRARALDACSVSDAMDALGLAGVVPGLGPLWPGAALAGRVITMTLAPGPPPAGREPVHLGARAITRSAPGDVVVVDNGGRRDMGSWGGLLSLAASLRGVAGMVTDGACRDVDEARELRFPTFGRGPAVLTARNRVHEQSVGEPIVIGGVAVATGDLVVADGSGVVVVPAAHVEAVIATAEGLARREAAMAERLRAGVPVDQVLGSSYEHMLRRDATD